MKKLTKKQQDAFADKLADLDRAQDNLREAVQEFNQKMDAEWAKLAEAITTFNDERTNAFADVEEAREDVKGVLEEIDGLREDVNSAQADFFDEKSEKWQEGDAGQSFAEWQNRWSDDPEISLDDYANAPEDVEVEQPEELPEPDECWADQVAEALPVDVEGETVAWTPHKPVVAPVAQKTERAHGISCAQCGKNQGPGVSTDDEDGHSWTCNECLAPEVKVESDPFLAGIIKEAATEVYSASREEESFRAAGLQAFEAMKPEDQARITKEIKGFRYIQALKMFKDITGNGLKESKIAIDAIRAKLTSQPWTQADGTH